MNPPKKSFNELVEELKARGMTSEEIALSLEQASDRHDRKEALDFDPLDAISAKLDKLQESVDSLAAKLDAK